MPRLRRPPHDHVVGLLSIAQQVLGHQPRLGVVSMLDIGSSEWLSMKQEDVELIVAAVNAYKPTTETATNQKFDWGEVFGPFISIIFGMATLIGVPALIDWLQH